MKSLYDADRVRLDVEREDPLRAVIVDEKAGERMDAVPTRRLREAVREKQQPEADTEERDPVRDELRRATPANRP